MNEITIRLDRNGAAAVPGGQLLLGYMGNHGNYRLRVDARSEWQGLTIRAHWHGPGAVAGTTLVENGGLDVPAAVTAQPGPGCITFEGSDGSRTVTSADVRYRVAANSGTEDAEMPKPGTPAWEEFVRPWLGKLDRIDEAEQNAADSARQAAESAADAGKSKQAAQTSAEAAERSRKAIEQQEQTAQENANKAAQSAKDAAASAAAAENSRKNLDAAALAARENAETAVRGAQSAAASASAAQKSQQAAQLYAQNAKDVGDRLQQMCGSLVTATPEEFGAAGDGVTDDAPALQKALESGRPVKLTKDLYLKSRVLVIDHDVVFDGDGHTLHCDGAALDFKENSDFVSIYSRTIAAEGADCKIYSETPMHYDTYHRGYIEYKGHKPIPVEETYEDYTVTGFMEHRAIVRNIRFSCRNFMGFVALNLRKMCHSLVENVQAVCEDYKGSGSVGILVDTSCFCTIRNCYACGWDDDLSCKVTNRGYGICANGNGILVDGCEAWDCKHTISVAGNRSYWSTDIRVTNCTFGCNYSSATRIDGSARFQQVVDSHAGGLGVRFDNCSIIIRNANESASAVAFFMTAPYVHVSGLEVLCDGGGCWATMGGLAEVVYLDNVRGENLVLQPGPMYEREREYHLHNCLFRRVQNSYNVPIRVYMTDCTVTQLVDQIQWLKADGCYFGHDLSWPSHACISILGEGIFTGCTIYGHNEDTIPLRRSIIEAPENSIQMQGCRIYIRRGKYPVFSANQPQASYWTENIFGFRPGTENDVLDFNELY